MPDQAVIAPSEASRIARFLGFRHWRTVDDMKLVRSVHEGFPPGTAAIVVRRIDPDGRFVKASDIIPKSTLSRRKGEALTKEQSEKVLALSRVFAELLRIYHEDTTLAARFLVQRHPLLENRAPIDVAKESIAGADLVLKLLAQADAGLPV